MDVVKNEMEIAIRQKYPNLQYVQLTEKICYYGTNYKKGMILTYGSTGGLPDFIEIFQIAIINDKLHFLAPTLVAWYKEHVRSYELQSSSTRALHLVNIEELNDYYPLAAYTINAKRMVTQKRFIHCK